MADMAQESYFDGNTFQRIGWRILSFLLTGLTLGLGYPWAMCMMQRWEIKHTVINGRRLKFTGHGHQLFGRYILWALLTVVTLGIFSIWFGLGMKKWVVRHTVYEGDDSGVKSRFTGGAAGWFCFHLLYGVVAVITLGIAIPWMKTMLQRWMDEHTEIGGKSLVFSGSGGQLFLKGLLSVLLTLLTLGIYALFYPVSLLKWRVSHTSRGNGPASKDEVPMGFVIAGVVVLAAVVVLGVVGFILPRAAIVTKSPAKNPKPSQTEPVSQTESGVEEFERILMGEWSNARRVENMIFLYFYEFPTEGELYISDRDYMNIHTDPFPGEVGDEYGWFVGPRGYPVFDANYTLTDLGDNRFTLAVVGSYDYDWDTVERYTCELTYVEDNMILIDGEIYVRGRYTLAEYAGIFGFPIEAG